MEGKVLIVEDNPSVLLTLERTVRDLGLECDFALDGEYGLEKALGKQYQLVLLDVTLPVVNGFELCKQVRGKFPTVPIIMVTSRDAEVDKVNGLSLGADDYIVKPFGERELAARITALLRRAERSSAVTRQGMQILEYGDLRIDIANRVVTLRGITIDFTSLEFDLLAHIASHPNQLFSRDDLMRTIWGYECSQFGSSITTYFCRLRSKLEKDPKNPRFIQTVHGVGYRFTGQLNE